MSVKAYKLFDEFNMSEVCFDDCDFEEMMRRRLKWAEKRRDQRLCDYEDKIAMKKIFLEHKVPIAQTLYSSYYPFDRLELLGSMLEDHCVVKPSHLTSGEGIYVINNGKISLPEPVGPGKEVMKSRSIKQTSLSEVIFELEKLCHKHAGDKEAFPLRSCYPGVVVEAWTPHEMEVRILAIFGEVMAGASDSQQRWTKKEMLDSGGALAEIVHCTERLANNTDILRVDFFVNENSIYANEMCTFLWPESRFFSGKYPLLMDTVKKKYSEAIEIVERSCSTPKLDLQTPRALQINSDWFRYEQIHEHLWLIQEQYDLIDPRFQTKTSNLYLLSGSTHSILIDTGFGYRLIKPVVDSLKGDKELYVICTHAHYDHIGGNGEFEIVHIHANEVSDASQQIDFSEIQNSGTDYSKQYGAYDFRRFPASNNIPLNDGDVFDLGDLKVEILLLSGHSKGSIGLLSSSGDFFTGDFHTEGISFLDPDLLDEFGTTLQKLKQDSRINHIFPAHGRLQISAKDWINQAEECFEEMKTFDKPHAFDSVMKCWCYYCRSHTFALYS